MEDIIIAVIELFAETDGPKAFIALVILILSIAGLIYFMS
jgi:hypothetical protein